MIGKNVIEIDASEFVKGSSSADHISDGGFSPTTQGVNLRSTPGVLYAPAAVVDVSTNLTDEIIASCEDPAYTGVDRVLLDDSGELYTLSTSTLTQRATGADLYTYGTTDLVPFNGGFIASQNASNGNLTRWTGAFALDTATWWTVTLSQPALSTATPWRPLLVYEKRLYVADKNRLHAIDENNAVSYGILVLATDDTISALGVDKVTGLMLIAVTQGTDYDLSRNGPSKILVYDGLSARPSRVIPINGTVSAMEAVDDRTYIFYGNNIGYWDGNNLQWLRKMSWTLGSGASDVVYPHHVSAIENTLYYVATDAVSSLSSLFVA